MKIRWSPRAQRELRQVRNYIAQYNPSAAERVVSRILSATQRAERFPYIGEASEEVDIRLLRVKGLPYALPYRVRGDVIEILAVFDQRRDPEDLF